MCSGRVIKKRTFDFFSFLRFLENCLKFAKFQTTWLPHETFSQNKAIRIFLNLILRLVRPLDQWSDYWLSLSSLVFNSRENEFHTLFSRFDPIKSNTILLWLVFIIMFLGVAFPRAKMKARISLVLLTLTGKKLPVLKVMDW